MRDGRPHLVATAEATDGAYDLEPARWRSVVLVSRRDPATAGEAARLPDAFVQAFVADPIVPSLVELLARAPRDTVVDVTSGPPTLTHAAQYAAALLRLRCQVRGAGQEVLALPPDPSRHVPTCWADLLRTIERLGRPTRVAEIATLTGLGESTVRYHVSGRSGYVGLVECGALSSAEGLLEISPLGRVLLERGIIPAARSLPTMRGRASKPA